MVLKTPDTKYLIEDYNVDEFKSPKFKLMTFKSEVMEYVNKEERFQDNVQRVYLLVLR